MRRAQLVAAVAVLVVHSSVALAVDPFKERSNSMTREALSRCETRLKQLSPGQAVGAETFGFHFYAVQSMGKKYPYVVADGWISSMSGGDVGASGGLGRYCGRDSSSVWGEQVFGYVWGGATLVPKYRVLTRAHLITQDEYARREKELSVGFVAGKAGTIYFADPAFVETREIAGPPQVEAAAQEGSKAKKTDLKSITEEMCSEASYQEAQAVLDSLAAGTLVWDVPSRLGGLMLTSDSGESYSLLMKGFLNTETMGPWTVSKPDGKYEVWTFGTMVKKKETPQRSLVFRNGSVVEVRPYTPKEELTGMLHP